MQFINMPDAQKYFGNIIAMYNGAPAYFEVALSPEGIPCLQGTKIKSFRQHDDVGFVNIHENQDFFITDISPGWTPSGVFLKRSSKRMLKFGWAANTVRMSTLTRDQFIERGFATQIQLFSRDFRQFYCNDYPDIRKVRNFKESSVGLSKSIAMNYPHLFLNENLIGTVNQSENGIWEITLDPFYNDSIVQEEIKNVFKNPIFKES